MNIEKFKSNHTVSHTGCWEWSGSKNQDGYGRVRWNSRLESAHRVSYELYKGTYEKTKHICHTCDNPSCINPDHLWLGDYKSNNLDKKTKGRAIGNSMPGIEHPKHKLTEEEVVEIFHADGTQSSLATRFNVSPTLIWKIKAKRCWKHLTHVL